MVRNFKDTNIFKIGKFLKDRPNKLFTLSDLSKNLKIPKKSVSSSLSRLKHGRNVTRRKGGKGRKLIVRRKDGKPRKQGYEGFKIGKINNKERGMWKYGEPTDFKTWKVDFKLKETKTKKRQSEWTDIMDLSGTATGIVPAHVGKSNVVEVSAHQLFRSSLDVMQDEGVFLWKSVREDDSKTVVFGAELIEENPLDENYDPTWDGEIIFVNNLAKTYKYPVSYDIQIDEYETDKSVKKKKGRKKK